MVEDQIEHAPGNIGRPGADDTVEAAKILHGVSVADVLDIIAFLGLATPIPG